MACPGDPVGAQHAFADGAELFHRRLAAHVARVDAELDPTNGAAEGAFQHHVLDAPVEAGPAQVRAVVGTADLKHLPRLVDADEARHARKFLAIEQHKGAIGRRRRKPVDAGVKTLKVERGRVYGPDLMIFGASRPKRITVALLEQLGAALVAPHRRRQALDHSSARSRATCSERRMRSM